jgi:hypothetical protein
MDLLSTLKNSWVQPDFVKQFAKQNASSSLGQYLLRIVEKCEFLIVKYQT